MSFKDFKPTAEQTEMLVKAGSADYNEFNKYGREVAKALELPLRQAILPGDITEGIFEDYPLPFGASPEFPLDMIAPGQEKELVGYTLPKHGYIPHKNFEADYVTLTTYDVGASADINLRLLRDGNWNMMGRLMEALYTQLTKKMNDDCFHTLLYSGVDRNIVVYDGDAAAGQFTKRVLSLAKTVMRRNGGGNSSSTNRTSLTDVFLSPEALEDIRNWGIDQIDEVTRREIYMAGDGSGVVSRIFGVNLHDIDELGVGQEYQLYFANELSGAMGASDVEVGIGLDLSKSNCFIRPMREDITVFEDNNLHRHGKYGVYAKREYGVSVLDNRGTILLSW